MSGTTFDRTSVRHKIGMCPACRTYVWGNVEISTTVSPATLSDDGKTNVYAHARPVAMQVEPHTCDKERDEAESPFGRMAAEIFGQKVAESTRTAPKSDLGGLDHQLHTRDDGEGA